MANEHLTVFAPTATHLPYLCDTWACAKDIRIGRDIMVQG
jgi:hypothetical protein